MDENKKDLLVKHLINIIDNHQYVFEESLTRFILMSLGKENLNGLIISGLNSGNYKCKVSIYEYVKQSFCDSFNQPYSKEYYDSLNQYGKDNHQSAKDSIKNYSDKLQIWKSLLNEISPELIVEKPINIVEWNGNKNVSFNCWFALRYPEKWASNFLINKEIWKLTNSEEKMLASELINPGRVLDFNDLYRKFQHQEVKLLLNLYLTHQEGIKETYLKSYLGLNVENWFDKIFNSQGLKSLINQGEFEEVSKIFDEESLKLLIKKTSLKTNVERYPEMLNNLLPIASPKSWIKACSGKSTFNINAFFDNKFMHAYGISLTKENSKNTRFKHGITQKILDQEFSYLSPCLNSSYINQPELIKFWSKIIKTNNYDLFISVSKNIGLPEKNTTFDCIMFYNMFDKAEVNYFNGKSNETIPLKEFYLSEKLNYSLREENNKQVRKIKI